MENDQDYFAAALQLLGSLGLLIYGMRMMSESLQKLAGPSLRHVLARMTTNRVTGMLTGVGVTAAVQSSTATTVMTVSFVNAGLLTLAQAISIIMGANIGTTLTAWIMSAGFSFNVTDIVYPVFLIALILIYRKKHRTTGEFLFGIAILFLGLGTLRQTGMDMHLGENESVLNFFASFDPDSFGTTLLFLLMGGVLTMCVQSSAAVMAITMILCSSGALPIYQGIALVMGENIGTTVTSNVAALSASTQARRAAFAHMFFNLFGVCWMLLVFHPFVDAVCNIVGGGVENLSVVLATFHTCFNLANTFILIWFVPQIERIVCFVIREKPEAEKGGLHMQYIQSGLMQTPEIAVLQAQKETAAFGKRVQAMFGMVVQLLNVTDERTFSELYNNIEQEEDTTDKIEIEIANYLQQVGENRLSDETKEKVRRMMREISELESIGDVCFKLARTMSHRQRDKLEFGSMINTKLKEMAALTDKALTQMNLVMDGQTETISIDKTLRIENDINVMRQKLKDDNITAVNNHMYTYAVGTLYTDMVNDFEKLGDYVVNVVEARIGQ
ncbi:MAG: Na/Pi cotransporter family protein [Bacteroidaceae bacterium]|nr:Na/Pi cotransporter family protein [Bacteroidaceae bacterium]